MTTPFLVSPVARFDVHHLLNPWMEWHEAVDGERAAHQWAAFRDALRAAGAELRLLPSHAASGAMTFTRDCAVVVAPGVAVVLHNQGRRGDVEPDHVAAWFRSNGYEVEALGDAHRIDGGNVVPTPEGWLIGLPRGVGADAAERLGELLREGTSGAVFGVPLAGHAYGHLDMALAELAGRGWLAYPAAFADPTMEGPEWERVLGGRPVITVDEHEARRLACNVVVVGEHVLGGGLSARLAEEVARLGLTPVRLELDEFRKAGGGAHCLTLGLSAHGRDP